MMRARALLCVGLVTAACAAGEADVRRPAGGPGAPRSGVPGVRAIGRFDTQDPAGPRFAWSGTGVAIRFRGPQLDARLRGGGGDSLEVVIDGVPTTAITLQTGKELYPVATGLADSEHEAVLVKRTEARVGEVQLLGFAQPLLPAPPAPERRIEVIGDSITAGYGNEGPNEHCHYTPQTENAYVAYGWLTARALDADISTVAWSGRTIDGMAEVYDRALPARPESRWEAHGWVPDAVVVNLGTNDVTRGDQQAPFVASLTKLVDRVRALYPKALIVCCIGPMLTDIYPPGKQTLTRARQYVRAAVAAKNKAGDARVKVLEFPTQDPAIGYGCDYHPSAKTHQMMAERLSAFLKTELGW